MKKIFCSILTIALALGLALSLFSCDFNKKEEHTEHTYGSWTVTTAATCTTAGREKRVCTYEGCGHEETQTIEPLGHDLISHEGQPATCNAAGFDAYVTCSRCTHSTYSEISAKGHSYDETGVCPTCSQSHPHEFGDWYVETEATCSEGGVEKRDCNGCEYSETRATSTVNHDYNSDGICSDCGALDPDSDGDDDYTLPAQPF